MPKKENHVFDDLLENLKIGLSGDTDTQYAKALDLPSQRAEGLYSCKIGLKGDQKSDPVSIVVKFRCDSTLLQPDTEVWAKKIKELSLQGYQVEIQEDGAAFELKISLDYSAGKNVYRYFLKAIFDGIVEASTNCLDAIYGVLAEWQHFFKSLRKDKKLTPEEQRGLWGELHILSTLLSNGKFTNVDVIQIWLGPLPNPQDFDHNGNTLEVKAILGSNEVHIHGLRQLDTSGLESIFLTAVHLSESNSEEGKTLFGLIESVRECISDTDARDSFEKKLGWVGYKEEHADKYDIDAYQASCVRCYEVKDDFPRLTRDSLSPALSVTDYVLDLEDGRSSSFELEGQIELEELLGHVE